MYEKSRTVNGKPSWKSDINAIWFSTKTNDWIIGSLENIGTSRGGISSDDNVVHFCPQQVPKDEWTYFKNGWQEAGEGDVTFECQDKGRNISHMRGFVCKSLHGVFTQGIWWGLCKGFFSWVL